MPQEHDPNADHNDDRSGGKTADPHTDPNADLRNSGDVARTTVQPARLDLLGLIATLLTGGLIVILALLASAVAGVLAQQLLVPGDQPPRFADPDAGMLVIALAAMQSVLILATLAVGGVVLLWHKVPLAETLALNRPQAGLLQSYLGASGVVVCGLLLYYLLLVLFPYDWRAEMQPFLELVRSSWAWTLPALLIVGAPVAEELLFRGYLLGALQRSVLGFAGAAALTSAGWTLLHVNYTWQPLISLFVVGLALAYLRRHTGSLWPAILAHGIWNLIAYLGLFTLYDTV